jgi:hypothetical protein
MALEIQGEVGRARQGNADGTNVSLRMGKTGELSVGQVHGANFEAVSRGNVYTATNQTGATSAAGLSATAPAMILHNPVGSGVNLSLIYAGCTHTVAFAAGATIWLAANTNPLAAAPTGTISTTLTRNCLLGGSNTSKAQILIGATTLPAAPVAISTLGVGLTGAITTVPSMSAIGRYFDGAIVLAPGSSVSIQTSTASGASGLFTEFVWEEVPLI